MNIILGMDAGTHGVRALAFDMDKQSVISSAGQDYPRLCAAGVQEMSPTILEETFRKTLAELFAKLPSDVQVGAMGITHQRGTVIPVDAEGRPLGPALCDSDSRAAGPETLHSLGLDAAAYYRHSGCPFISFNGLAKILWVKEHQPELYCRAAAWLSPQDYLLSHLTGQLSVTEGSASRNGYLSIESRTLLNDLLPHEPFLRWDCVPVGGHCGVPASSWTAEFPQLREAAVIAVPGDQPAAVIGCGAAASGDLAMNLGTTFVASLCHNAPVCDPESKVTTEVLPQGGYAPEFGTGAGGQFTDWLARLLLNGDISDRTFWKELDLCAASVPAGAEGLRVVPLLWQVTSPGVSGGIFDLGIHHGRKHLIRAAYEGLACEAGLSIQHLESCTGRAPTTLRVFGGMSANDTFLQILATLTGKRVLAAAQPQASALGAALTSALACGFVESIESTSALAENYSRQYLPEKEEGYDGFLENYRASR